MLAWRYEHRIRRREDLLFSFGSERGPFPVPRMVRDIQVVARPLAPLGASPLDAPGSIILEDLESVSTTLFCCSCMDYSFRLIFAFVSMCRSRQAQFFLQVLNTGTVCTRGTDTFSVLAHSFSPFVSHFDTHFYTSVTAPCSAGRREYTKLLYTYACKSRDLKAADSGFHFGPCAVRFIH